MSWKKNWDQRAWGDRKFLELSMLPCSGQSLFIYLAIGPFHRGMPGLYELRRADLLDRTGWTAADLDAAAAECTALKMAYFDWKFGVVYCPNGVKNDPPCSAKNVGGWQKEYDRIPESDLKWYWYNSLVKFCVEEKGFDPEWNVDGGPDGASDGALHPPPDGLGSHSHSHSHSQSQTHTQGFVLHSGKKSSGKKSTSNKSSNPIAERVIAYLNEQRKIIHPETRGFGIGDSVHQGFILGRMKDGATEEDMIAVIDLMVAEWGDDAKMFKMLRPETLFNKTKYASYIANVGVGSGENAALQEFMKGAD